MRKTRFSIFIFLACAAFMLFLSGCLSVSESPNPRFYMLKPIDASDAGSQFSVPANTIIVIGPVKIPEYQNRPQIVTQDNNKMLTFAQFDRWGEPLDSGIVRLLIEDLSMLLPGAEFERFPCNFAIPINYQVILDVIQLESNLNDGLLFVVQWSIIDSKERHMLFNKRSVFNEQINPHNYSGLVDALSRSISLLSKEIVQGLSTLPAPSIGKK